MANGKSSSKLKPGTVLDELPEGFVSEQGKQLFDSPPEGFVPIPNEGQGVPEPPQEPSPSQPTPQTGFLRFVEPFTREPDDQRLGQGILLQHRRNLAAQGQHFTTPEGRVVPPDQLPEDVFGAVAAGDLMFTRGGLSSSEQAGVFGKTLIDMVKAVPGMARLAASASPPALAHAAAEEITGAQLPSRELFLQPRELAEILSSAPGSFYNELQDRVNKLGSPDLREREKAFTQTVAEVSAGTVVGKASGPAVKLLKDKFKKRFTLRQANLAIEGRKTIYSGMQFQTVSGRKFADSFNTEVTRVHRHARSSKLPLDSVDDFDKATQATLDAWRKRQVEPVAKALWRHRFDTSDIGTRLRRRYFSNTQDGGLGLNPGERKIIENRIDRFSKIFEGEVTGKRMLSEVQKANSVTDPMWRRMDNAKSIALAKSGEGVYLELRKILLEKLDARANQLGLKNFLSTRKTEGNLQRLRDEVGQTNSIMKKISKGEVEDWLDKLDKLSSLNQGLISRAGNLRRLMATTGRFLVRRSRTPDNMVKFGFRKLDAETRRAGRNFEIPTIEFDPPATPGGPTGVEPFRPVDQLFF